MRLLTHQSVNGLCVLPLGHPQGRHPIFVIQAAGSMLLFCHRNGVALNGVRTPVQLTLQPRSFDTWSELLTMNSSKQVLKDVVSLCKRRGFVFPRRERGEEQYVYGPLGVELKRNLITEW